MHNLAVMKVQMF